MLVFAWLGLLPRTGCASLAQLSDFPARLLARPASKPGTASLTSSETKSAAAGRLKVDGAGEGEVSAGAQGMRVDGDSKDGVITGDSSFDQQESKTGLKVSATPDRSQLLAQAVGGFAQDFFKAQQIDNAASSSGTGDGQAVAQSSSKGSSARGNASQGLVNSANHQQNTRVVEGTGRPKP